MWDLLYLPVLLFGWFALFRWVLPSLGIPTCLGGACGLRPLDEIEEFDRQDDRDRRVAGRD